MFNFIKENRVKSALIGLFILLIITAIVIAVKKPAGTPLLVYLKLKKATPTVPSNDMGMMPIPGNGFGSGEDLHIRPLNEQDGEMGGMGGYEVEPSDDLKAHTAF